MKEWRPLHWRGQVAGGHRRTSWAEGTVHSPSSLRPALPPHLGPTWIWRLQAGEPCHRAWPLPTPRPPPAQLREPSSPLGGEADAQSCQGTHSPDSAWWAPAEWPHWGLHTRYFLNPPSSLMRAWAKGDSAGWSVLPRVAHQGRGRQ